MHLKNLQQDLQKLEKQLLDLSVFIKVKQKSEFVSFNGFIYLHSKCVQSAKSNSVKLTLTSDPMCCYFQVHISIRLLQLTDAG